MQKLPEYPVWHVESDDRWELAMTFLRIAKYYESPNPDFQGKIFTLEEYMDWYVRTYRKEKNLRPYGAFTYASDWSAFNVPGSAVLAVYLRFSEHSKKESRLFHELQEQSAFAKDSFYVIGSKRGAQKFFEHEYRHALFALNSDYRAAMTLAVEEYQIPQLRSWVLGCYSQSVLIDEIQAYALTGWPKRLVATDEMRTLRQKLKLIEKNHLSAH